MDLPPGNPFDLNIEEILENWETYDGIREVIANAIDEQILRHTREIEIYKDKQRKWHIRDYGQGLQYAHLTQKENGQKLTNPNVIGKFGIGLKDALATFDRKGARVLVRSRFNDITTAKYTKHGFDILTLHAFVAKPSDPTLVGTVLTTHICHGSIRQRDRDNESLDAAVHSSIHGYYPDLSQ